MILMPITIINLILAILLTSATGGIMVILWMLVGRGLEKLGFIHIRYELLKLVSFFFLCPVSYIALKAYEMKIRSGALFTPTPSIVFLFSIVLIIWCIGTMSLIGWMLFNIYMIHRKSRYAFPCDKDTELQLTVMQEQQGLKKSEMSRSYLADTPYVTGFWKAKIVLPVRNYTEEELRVVLLHELNHYKQGDLRLKYFSFIILALHFFNPLAWMLFDHIQKFSEYVCDYRTCLQVGGTGKYFELLIAMGTDGESVNVLSSHLWNKEIDMRQRIRKVKEVSKIKQRSKVAVIAVLSAAMIISTASVFATTVKAAEYYVNLYESTQSASNVDATLNTNQQIEYVPADHVEDVATVIAENDQMTRLIGAIDNWEINPNSRWYTSYFKCAEGETIAVTAVATPADKQYYIGVEDAIGNQYRLQGSGNLYYPFEANVAGYWRVFVQNLSDTTITVNGSYITPN